MPSYHGTAYASEEAAKLCDRCFGDKGDVEDITEGL